MTIPFTNRKYLMTFKAVIFDLDGTLLDTLQDLFNTLNSVLSRHGYPIHTLDECRFLVGHGMRELVRKGIPEKAGNEETIDILLKDLMDEYADNWKVNSRPYPGIPRLLDTITERKVKWRSFRIKLITLPVCALRVCLGNGVSMW